MSDEPSPTTAKSSRTAGAFDVRSFIAALIGLYGVVLVLTAIFDTTAEDVERAGGVNVNLWAGGAMVLFALAFQAWAVLRPVRVPPSSARQDRAAENKH